MVPTAQELILQSKGGALGALRSGFGTAVGLERRPPVWKNERNHRHFGAPEEGTVLVILSGELRR